VVQVSDNSSRPLRFRSWNRQSGPSTNRARIHECTNTPGPVAQVSNLQRKSRLEPPRRHGREGFLFLCVLCAFAVQILEPPKRAVHESGANTRMHEYARPGGASFQLTEKIAVGTAKTPRARRFSFPLRLLRLCGSNSGTAKTGCPRIGREYTNARIRPARWRKSIAVGTAKTPRARRFSYFSFAPLRFKFWNRQDVEEAKNFYFPLRSWGLCGSVFWWCAGIMSALAAVAAAPWSTSRTPPPGGAGPMMPCSSIASIRRAARV